MWLTGTSGRYEDLCSVLQIKYLLKVLYKLQINQCTYIVASNKKANSVWTAIVALGTDLKFVAQITNESGNGQRFIVGIAMVEALGSHVATEETGISCQTSNCHTHVCINRNDLFLVSR